jgi:putative transposase
VEKLQAYKYRLNVRDSVTETHLSRQVGCDRFVWNKALAMSQDTYPGYAVISALLPTWKEEHPWLKEVDSIGLQQSLRQLDTAWKNFFKFPDHFKKPQFKKSLQRDAYRVVGAAAQKTGQARIWVPKVGWLSFRQSCPWLGQVTSMTITRKARRWYVSLQCKLDVDTPQSRQNEDWLGIDVGIAQYATLSTGEHKEGVRAFRTNRRKLARLQRRLARQKSGSARRTNTKHRIAELHHHIAMMRQAHAHKVSSQLVKNHGRIRMEDLRLVNMMASAKGTVENPGKNVAQKRGLNRHLADQGLRQLRQYIEYKLNWSGGAFEAVNPALTSQKCHACKHVARENRPSQAVFLCIVCGHSDNADINAAKNIRDTAGGVPRSERARRRRRRPACETHTTETV